MNHLNLVVVVLNYINYEDTINCVNSLLEQTILPQSIVIVENGSPNNSLNILKELYEKKSLVTIIENNENLGFAKGNNTGISYARNILNSNFIFVLNSDTILNQFLLEDIMKLNIENDVGVFSPTVTNELVEVQNPTIQVNEIKIFTIKAVFSLIFGLILHLPIIGLLYKNYSANKKHEINENINEKPAIRNFKHNLHGSAFFLTPLFFKFYSQPYSKTFLYWEEINLIWYLHKVGLRAAVYQTSEVIHMESKSVVQIATTGKVSLWKLSKSFASLINSLPLYFATYKYINKKYN